jgi:hypothetical protein
VNLKVESGGRILSPISGSRKKDTGKAHQFFHSLSDNFSSQSNSGWD